LAFVVNIRTYEIKDERNKEEMNAVMEKEIGKKVLPHTFYALSASFKELLSQ